MGLLARRNLFHVGKKNIRTDEPSEHVDTKILERLWNWIRGNDSRWGLGSILLWKAGRFARSTNDVS